MTRSDTKKKHTILIAAIMLTAVLVAVTMPASAVIGNYIEVDKTVYDPDSGEWVKALDASINDTLRFRVNMSFYQIDFSFQEKRFWDILDCSLVFAGNATINGSPWYELNANGPSTFKPKVLHPDNPWDPNGSPDDANFTELCPTVGIHHHIVCWEDTNNDSRVSPCDQVQIKSGGGGTILAPLQLATDGYWYHVDRVPYTLNLSTVNGTKYFDSVHEWDAVNLSDPVNSTWLEVCCCKDRYTLIGWEHSGCPVGGIRTGDTVTMRNERTQQVVEYTVEEVLKDLVVSREWTVPSTPPGGQLDADSLGSYIPCDNYTLEYDATVVRCGVDNNTFRAKGSVGGGSILYYRDENVVTLVTVRPWYYSDPTVVTITVPCPSGDAADVTPVIKDLFTVGEPVYALGRDFAPNKNVDIYITPVRTWAFGDNISDYAIVGPVPVVTDPNGSIGVNPRVLMWPDPVPGRYHMVFDDPDGFYEPGVDLYDLFEVSGRAVPLITPLGIAALIGLLSVIATSTLIRRKKR